MTDTHQFDRRRFLLLAGGALLAACGGSNTSDPAAAPSTSAEDAPDPERSSPSPEASRSASPSPSPTEDAGDVATRSPTTDFPEGIHPVRIEIPAIGVDAPVIDLNLTAQEVEVPEDFDDAGWWVQTRRPGEIGPAVIGGHVDSKTGPAVFFRLKELSPGDEIIVLDEAGERRSFVVSKDPIQVDKLERPPEVFGFTNARPELRLITCGGEFNPNVGHYTDNIVVFAHDPAHEA